MDFDGCSWILMDFDGFWAYASEHTNFWWTHLGTIWWLWLGKKLQWEIHLRRG
jgi:hypothetical protein